jgi:hypothetical protein
MSITPSKDRRLPQKLASKLPLSLGSDTPILRHAQGNRNPDSHIDPPATRGHRTSQGTIVKGSPRPA